MDRERKALHLALQETRANIIQNILGQPTMMPSLKELDYFNPDKSMGAISGHIDRLVDTGIVLRVSLPQSYGQKNLPNTFFTLSDGGYKLLKDHEFYIPHLQEIRDEYAGVEKRDDIKEAECAPRPTVDVEYDHPLQGDGISVVEPADDCNPYGEWIEVNRNDDQELLV